MKRIYIAMLLFALAAGAAAFEWGYVSAKADSFVSRINQIDKLMQNLDCAEAEALCKQAEKDWYGGTGIIDAFLIHDCVDEIGVSISRMTSYAESGSGALYFAESAEAKKELASVKESEFPSFENIF